MTESPDPQDGGGPGDVTEELRGLIVVDKPSGCTSHDVVDRIRKVFGMSRVGHSGTLDPFATGILLIGLGRATRLLSFLQNLPKTYRGVVRFGVATSSQDGEGEVVAEKVSQLTLDEVREAAGSFVGAIEQIPPMVSAVKIAGEPLYRAARRGEVVERAARKVRIYNLEVEEFDPEAQTAQIYVRCSSGTYVRTLAADLGEALGPGGHLSALRRLSVGSFSEAEAIPLADLEVMGRFGAASRVLSMAGAMRDFPQVTVKGDDLNKVAHGQPFIPAGTAGGPSAGEAGFPDKPPGLMPKRPGELPVLSLARTGDRPAHEAGMTAGIPVAMLDSEGNLLAVYRRSGKGLKPAAVLA